MYIPENIKKAIIEIQQYCTKSSHCKYCELFWEEERQCLLFAYAPEKWEPEKWGRQKVDIRNDKRYKIY